MRKWFLLLAATALAVGIADDARAGCGCRSSGATVRIRFRVRERSRCQTAAPPVSGCAPCGQAVAPSPASCPEGNCPAFGIRVEAVEQTGLFGRLLSLHNAERARRGLTTLRLDVALCQGAQQAAQAQASRGYVGHFLPLAGASAENAARGQLSEEEAWFSWANSPGHLRNAIGPYTRVGFGVVHGAGGPYWAARFQ